ncbi:MAG TPA: putative Ig domain-containing protein [Pseudomonadota bacterium]|nr:putative Ig domain-containing protein [Pseudomonadota bacterium]
MATFPVQAQVASLESVIYGIPTLNGQGNQDSSLPACCGRQQSADGRYVVFVSLADNLVANDTNLVSDVFLRDTVAGTTQRISVSSSAAQANNQSRSPSISADGRYIAFESVASNLVAVDSNGTNDIFLHDRVAATTLRISVGAGGVEGNAFSQNPSISADGGYVAFESFANNLVSGDSNGSMDIFRYDRVGNSLLRVNLGVSAAQANSHSSLAVLSDDGNVVAFASQASNLVANDSNGAEDVFVRDVAAGTTARVSIDSAGAQSNAPSTRPALSSDGQIVAFESTASNLVSGDNNSRSDIFVHQRGTSVTTRVSVSSANGQGNEASTRATISADGRYVAFQSDASNLIVSDNNAVTDIYLHDRNDASSVRVSVETGGAQANNPSVNPSISADGSLVLFQSTASNLLATSDSNGFADVFRRDRTAASTLRVSLADAAGPFAEVGNGQSNLSLNGRSQISGDGRFVVFETSATNLFPGDSDASSDVMLFDRQTASLEVISISTAGVLGNSQSVFPAVSADGRYVAFRSYASNLVANDTNGYYDVFVRDRQLAQTTRVSVATGGAQAYGDGAVSISGDGRYVAFASSANNLVVGDSNNTYDIFVHDRDTVTTTRVSVDSAGLQATNSSTNPSLSSDGRYVAFQSDATNLVAGDNNGASDVFVHDRNTASTSRVSVDGGGQEVNSSSSYASISGDGTRVAFGSNASNLVPGDINGQRDVFVRDLSAGTTSRVNISSAGLQANNYSDAPAISADGRTVVFYSQASNLSPLANAGYYNVFARDLLLGVTSLISTDSERRIGASYSTSSPAVSADGTWVAFASDVSNWILQRGRNGPSQDVFLAQRLFQQQSTAVITADTPDPSVVGLAFPVVVSVTGPSAAPSDGQVRVQSSSGEFCIDSDGPVANAGAAEFSCVLTINSAGSRDLTAAFSLSQTHIDATSVIEFHSVQALPSLTIADVTQNEGTGATTQFSFTVTRSHNLNAVSVRADTANSSASAPGDYTAISNQIVNFAAGGSLSANVVVDVVADSVLEPNEVFAVNLSAASGGTISDAQGFGTISNDDSASLAIGDVTQVEGTGATSSFVFTVTLTGDVYTSFNVSASPTAGTATPWSDFDGYSSNVSFSGTNGETRTVSVPVYGDPTVELDETFFVDLASPGLGITLADAQGLGTIQNDDVVAINPASLANAQIGVAYFTGLSAGNGSAPYSFLLQSGSLPAGLSLAANGQLSGTPTEAGSFNFVVQASDSTAAGNGGPFSNTRNYALTVVAPNIVVSPGSLPNGIPPVAYSQTLTGSGGTATYAFALTAGSLPPGLTLEADGDLIGTPTTPGSYNFDVTATDSSTGTGSPFAGVRSYALTIDNNPPTLTTPTSQTILEDSAPLQLVVTVGDEESADASLTLNAASSAPSIIPTPTVQAGASADQRVVVIDSLADANGGPVSITLSLADTHSGNSSVVFDVTVTPVNDRPTLQLAANINEVAGTTGFRSLANFVQSIVLGPPDEAQNQTLLSYSVAPVADPNGIVSSANLALNGTLTYTLTGRGGTARLAVTAIDNGGSANGGNPYSTAVEFEIAVAAGADLQISKSDQPTIVQPNQALLYDIYVANAGPSPVTGARVQDSPPATLADVSWSCTPILLASCSNLAGTNAIDELVNLQVGGVLRYSMSARVNTTPGTIIDNTAVVTAPTGVAELDITNNTDTDSNILLLDGIFVDGFEIGPNPITVPFTLPPN